MTLKWISVHSIITTGEVSNRQFLNTYSITDTYSVLTQSVIGKGDRHIYPYAWDTPTMADIYI